MRLSTKALWLAALATGALATRAYAQESAPALDSIVGDHKVAMDTMWVMLTAMLVFFMNLGFAMVESGLARAKNTVNILAKNYVVFAVSALAFYVVGWGLMFGNGNSFLGLEGLFNVSGADNSPLSGDAYAGAYSSIAWATVPLWAKFFFQLVFAGTAATIVSGAVAERIKFGSFIVFSFVLVALMYPLTGHWIWGGGWLASLGFWDFAGSTVVHSVGGWAALAGVIVLGPRIGKYKKDGSVNPIPGHSMTSATLGGLVLWFGWYGFNPGSTMAAAPGDIARVAVTTTMAAASATVAATLMAWTMLKKPDLSMIINGTLAGLVAITAPCAYVSVNSSIVIGIIAGVGVVPAVLFFDKVKLDDPVGALSVHLVNGIWGTIAVGLFAQDQFIPNTTGNGLLFGGGADLLLHQLAGVAAVGGFTFAASMGVWHTIKAIMGIRVSAEEEIEGLDIGEHGAVAYPDFQGVTSGGHTTTSVNEAAAQPHGVSSLATAKTEA